MDGCLLRRGSAYTAPSAGSSAQPPTPRAAAAADALPRMLGDCGLWVLQPGQLVRANETGVSGVILICGGLAHTSILSSGLDCPNLLHQTHRRSTELKALRQSGCGDSPELSSGGILGLG